MDRFYLYQALTEFQKPGTSRAPSPTPVPSPSRRRAVKLLAGAAFGALAWRLGLGEAGAACKKAGAKCDKKTRCCKGAVCKRRRCVCKKGRTACRGACRNLKADRNNCGKCGRRCGTGPGTACVAGVCVVAIGGTDEGSRFDGPRGVAVDANGRIYVADRGNSRITVLNPDGSFRFQIGGAGSQNGQFRDMHGVAVASNGDFYVADSGNNRVQQFDDSGNHIRSWGASGGDPGEFSLPVSIAIGGSTVVVVDFSNHRLQRFSLTGTFLGQFGGRGSAASQFTFPRNVALDAAGNIYVADTGNGRVQVFDPGGAFLRAFDVVNLPVAIAVGEDGDVYVSQQNDDPILRFTAAGEIKQAIGRSGTGIGQLDSPAALAVDKFGVLTVADTGNDRIQQFHL